MALSISAPVVVCDGSYHPVASCRRGGSLPRGRCFRRDAVRLHQVIVSAMTDDEVWQAVTSPAEDRAGEIAPPRNASRGSAKYKV